MYIDNSVSTEMSSDAVVIGPENGDLYIGSIQGLIKLFKGFIWEFDYYTYSDAEEAFGNCQGFCRFCPSGGCIPT
jgi:hypothetical protein